MSLFKSFLRPVNTLSWHCCVVQAPSNGISYIKQIKLNYNNRYLLTSPTKHGRWHLKNVKPQAKNSVIQEELKTAALQNNSYALLLRPFAFTVVFCSATFVGTAVWQYENIRKKAMLLLKKNWLTDRITSYGKKKYTWRQELNKLWNQLTEGQKLFVPICFINLVVFLAWKVDRLHPVMIKYFSCSPFNKNVCLPMVLSIFSHYNFFHLSANMYVLYSFSSSAVHDLGKEQFLGLYLAGGVISSFTSYLYKVIRSQPSLSLGASGAIMATVAYVCFKYPDSQLSIILLPWIVFPAETGIKSLMALDLLGCILFWKFFDHAAHLGGSLWGMGWCYWGNTYIWQNREPLLEWWHEIRNSK